MASSDLKVHKSCEKHFKQLDWQITQYLSQVSTGRRQTKDIGAQR